MARRKFSNARMIEAIQKAEGNLSAAARMLKTTRRTVHRYVSDYEDVRAAYEEANDTVLDVVENKLIEQAKLGLPEQVRFFLRTKGRSRGYGDRLDSHVVTEEYNPADFSLDENRRIAAGESPAVVRAERGEA